MTATEKVEQKDMAFNIGLSLVFSVMTIGWCSFLVALISATVRNVKTLLGG